MRFISARGAFYKKPVMNGYFQFKVISVNPKSQLSLQSHNHREEHWIDAHGRGTVQLDNFILNVTCGSPFLFLKDVSIGLPIQMIRNHLSLQRFRLEIILAKTTLYDMKIYTGGSDEI